MDRIKNITRGFLNEIFSERIIQQLIVKFKGENPDLTDEIIKAYIDRFQQIKDSPKVQQKDITKYSWNNLENVIIKNQPKRIKTDKGDNNDIIYNENGLEIIKANSLNTCVRYGEGYKFCISARGNDNQFYDYRVVMDKTPYFVIDNEMSKEKNEDKKFIEPDHFLVIMVPNPKMDRGRYEVTGANNSNNDEDLSLTWNEIVRKQPKLQNLQHLFVYLPAGEEEILRNDYEIKLMPLIQQYKGAIDLISNDDNFKLHTFTSINKEEYNILHELINDENIQDAHPEFHQYLQEVYKVMSGYIKELSILKSK